MADWNEPEEDKKYKGLVTQNKSEAEITLYIYSGWAPFCKFSTLSKIIKPNETCRYYEETSFKFEIVAKKHLLRPQECKEDTLITITESLECQTKNLAQIENGRRILLRQIHRDEELESVAGMPNLYDVLGLDMEEVRKMENEEAKDAIQNAYRKQMRIWHPDRNFGDHEMATQINVAKEILINDATRARYHNLVDYNKGWSSPKRWKAVFWPDCYTKEQKKAYRRRIKYLGLSICFAVLGIVASVFTAGAAAPLVVILGGILGGALTGAGIQSLSATVSKTSVLDGFDRESWALKALIGAVGGAVTGGAAVGITAGMVGIGSAALESGAVTAGQYVGMGAATGAVGGVATSLSSDATKKFVDEEKVTWKQVARHACFGVAIGGVAGTLGGLVTKGIVDSRASAATSTLEGDAVEQVSAMTGGRRVAHAVAGAVSRQVTASATKAMLGTVPKVVEERLDDSVENQTLANHAKSGFENAIVDAAQSFALYAAGGSIGQGFRELKLYIYDESYSRNAASYPNSDENNQGLGNDTNTGEGTGEENSEQSSGANEEQEDNEPEGKMAFKLPGFAATSNDPKAGSYHNSDEAQTGLKQPFFQQNESHSTIETKATDDQCPEGHCRSSEQNPHEVNVESITNQSSNGDSYEENREPSDERNKKLKADEAPKKMIKYRSKGAWISRMIVTFYSKGKKHEKEVSGDGKRVYIPADATNVEVKFQVRRPDWGDIMTYDRFEKKWSDTPHIFRYEKATDRTFTISGPLWWEAVMRVNDEYHEETKEMS